MKAEKKPLGITHKIREKRRREQRIVLAVTAAILIASIFISGFLINSMQGQRSTGQPSSFTSERKAAIVDQLSLTFPNPTFVETATAILKQAGYAVDYFSGENVTVEFFRNLPTYGYKIAILRAHSSATNVQGKESPVVIFTSERYSSSQYVSEQLNDQLANVAFSLDEMKSGTSYFGILPGFVTDSMAGKFQDTTIIMMGCQGLENAIMAKALIKRGAKAYTGWSGPVSSSRTDQATIQLLQHLVAQGQTIRQAVGNTAKEVGSDPIDNSMLGYYPVESGNYVIQG